MLVTFLSGGMSGFVAGRASAPEPAQHPTVVDNLVEDLRHAGMDREPDLQKARGIYGRYLDRVKDLKGEVEHLFKDRLQALATDAEDQIQKIMNTYPAPAGETKEK